MRKSKQEIGPCQYSGDKKNNTEHLNGKEDIVGLLLHKQEYKAHLEGCVASATILVLLLNICIHLAFSYKSLPTPSIPKFGNTSIWMLIWSHKSEWGIWSHLVRFVSVKCHFPIRYWSNISNLPFLTMLAQVLTEVESKKKTVSKRELSEKCST